MRSLFWKHSVVAFLVLVVVDWGGVVFAADDQFSATCQVKGKARPKPDTKRHLKNGEFLIVKNHPCQAKAGDGIDEFTVWLFDLSGHKRIKDILSDDFEIKKADLTLTMIPAAASAKTDAVFIHGSVRAWASKKFHVPPGLEDATPNETFSKTYDLIEEKKYTSAELKYFLKISTTGVDKCGFSFDPFLDSSPGQIPMVLHDDSIISEATLTLLFERALPDEDRDGFPPAEDVCKPIPEDQYPTGCSRGGDQS